MMRYFKGIFILAVLFGIILSGNACNRILSDNWTMDSRFKGDIIEAPRGWEFRFRPDKMPVKGKTTEQEIYAIYTPMDPACDLPILNHIGR